VKIFGAAFDRLKSLLAPNAAPNTPPTFAPQANFSPSAAAAADGRIRVDYSDYDAGVIAAGAKDILRRRAATQATAERAYAAGTKYVDEAVGGFYGNQVNAAIDLANLATKIPRSVTGTPGLARVEVTGEYWNQPLRREAAEIGAGLGLPVGQIGKAGTALIVGATATAGTQAVTGQDVETGRKLTPIERGLNGLGAVGGAAAARNEVGQVMAKTEEAAKRAAGKFPTGGGPATQAITNEGLTVTVPTPKTPSAAAQAAQARRNDWRDLFGDGPETQTMREVTAREAGIAAQPKHHVFPQQHRAWFEERGFVGERNIDNFTVQLDEATHQAIHGGGNWRLARKEWSGEWNRKVMTSLTEYEKSLGRKLTFEEIKGRVEKLMEEYGVPFEYQKYK
jgi:hypothetical protein